MHIYIYITRGDGHAYLAEDEIAPSPSSQPTPSGVQSHTHMKMFNVSLTEPVFHHLQNQ